jgi:hypothetical protein
VKKILFFIFLFPLATLTYAHAASGLLINGSYHTTLDTEKYSVICSANLEFSNNGTQLIYSLVDNQVSGTFCIFKKTILYKCKQDTGAGRISCVDELNPDSQLNFIVANDHRFVDVESGNIFKFITAGIKKATVYVYDFKVGWKFLADSQVCTMPSGATKTCLSL